MTSHLDDEQLSAAVDGEASADDLAHLQTCHQCRQRADALGQVARMVAAPVSVDADLREHAVAAALGGSRRPARMAWLAAVAAVVVGTAVAVPLLARSSSTSKTVSTAAANKSTPPAALATDLGPQSDPRAVAALVEQRLRTNDVAGAAADGRQAAAQGAPAAPTPEARGTCLTEGASVAGFPPSALRYQATLVWQARPALVMVFGPDPHPAGVVIGQPTCELLATLPL